MRLEQIAQKVMLMSIHHWKLYAYWELNFRKQVLL